MKPLNLLFPFIVALGLESCSNPDSSAGFNRDSVVAAIRDSFSRVYADSSELATALWEERIVIERDPKNNLDYYFDYRICIPVAKWYATSDLFSKPKGELRLGMPVTLSEEPGEYENELSKSHLRRIRLQDSTLAYISDAAVTSHTFYTSEGNQKILMGSTLGRFAPNRCRVVLCSKDFEKIIDTLSFLWWGGEGGSVEGMTYIPNVALKNIPFAIVFVGSNAACPEHHSLHWIVVIQDKLKDLIQTSSGGEGGQYSKKELYLPIRLENGKIFLAPNVSPTNMFDSHEMRLNIFNYPVDSVKIPIDQVVLVVEESAEYLMDSKYRQRYDKEGKRLKRVDSYAVKYYRWDGENLKIWK